MTLHGFRRTSLALVTGAAVALAAAGCGDDEQQPATGEARSESAQQEPAPESSGGLEAGSTEQPTEITGGSTTVRLDGRLRRVLELAGVELEPTGAARARGDELVFPIRQGRLDLDTSSGRLAHEGGLRFSVAGQRVEATDLRVDAERGLLTGEVAGRRLPLFSLDLGTPRVPQTGDVIVLPGRAASLTDDAAAALNERLGVDVFSGDLRLGDVTVRAQRP